VTLVATGPLVGSQRSIPDRGEREMNNAMPRMFAAAVLAVLSLAGSVSAGPLVCANGRYCAEVRSNCIKAGEDAAYCQFLFERCVYDHCAQP
ncbi:hypothetical protein QEG52_001190, partial [Stenotrophomonas maltophilia]